MRNLIFIAITVWGIAVQAIESGPVGTVLRMPPSGGRATMGPLDLSSVNSTTGYLGISKINGLTSGACLFGAADGTVLQTAVTDCVWSATAKSLGIGEAPVASAALDVASTTKGVLFPRMSSTQRDAITSPADGLVIYNTTRGHLQQYQASSSRWLGVGQNLGEASVSQLPSAAFQVDSTTRGALLPRMSSTQRDAISAPATGLEIYNTTTNQKNVFNGSAWVAVGAAGGGGGGENLLDRNGGNWNAEQGIAGLTNSGGTLSVDTANAMNGLGSFLFTSTATGDYVDSPLVTVQSGFNGRKCQIHFPYYRSFNGVGGVADFDVVVLKSDGTELARRSALPLTDGIVLDTKTAFQTFDCPQSGTQIKYRVIRTSTYAVGFAFNATFEWDDAFLGQGRNTINTFGPIITGWVNDTCTTNWTQNTVSTCKWRRVGDTMEVVQKLAFSGQPNSGVNLLVGPPAAYQLDVTKTGGGTQPAVYTGGAGVGGLSNNSSAAYNLNVQFATTTAPQFYVMWANASAGNQLLATNVPITTWSGYVIEVAYRAPIVGWTAERAPVEGNTYDTTGWRVDASIQSTTGTSAAFFGAYAAPGVTLDANNFYLVNNVKAGTIPAQITCANGTASVGLNCDSVSANESIGVTYVQPKAGLVRACFDFNDQGAVNSGGNINTQYRLVETNNNSTAVVTEASQTTASTIATPAGNGYNVSSQHVCNDFNFTAGGMHTIRLMVVQTVAGTVTTRGLLMENARPANGRDVHVTVEPLNESWPAPVFNSIQNVLTANSYKVDMGQTGMKMITGYFQGNSTGCPIIIQTGGAWLSSSVRNVGANCLINFTPGFFTQAPACSGAVVQYPNNAVAGGFYGVNNPTANSVSFSRTNSAPSWADMDFMLICVGK